MVNTLKSHMIILLCFSISLTERFTQASIPLIVDHLGLSSFEMSLLLSALAASTVFTGLIIAPYIDTYDQKRYLGLIGALGISGTLSYFMFGLTQGLEWGCSLMFCIGAVLRIINYRRLAVINGEVDKSYLSRAHTRMQLSITLAMAAAPLCLSLILADDYLDFTVAILWACLLLSLFTSSFSVPAKHATPPTLTLRAPKELNTANYFIFTGMLLSGLFLSILLAYCQSSSDNPTQLYTQVIFSQVVGLIIANVMFERFFGEHFRMYGILIIIIAACEFGFIFTHSSSLINAFSFLIGFCFQIMFLRSHNQFQIKIPKGMSAKFNGIRGMYAFIGVTFGYITGPILQKLGGTEMVLLACSATAILFLLFLGHLAPSSPDYCGDDLKL